MTEENTETKTVRVTRVVEHPLNSIWEALMTPEGNQLLLGEGGQLGFKGENWQANDGTYGITRSFHPLEQIRFSWHAQEDAPMTMVDLQLRASGEDATELNIAHERLPQDADATAFEQRWSAVLDQIGTHAK